MSYIENFLENSRDYYEGRVDRDIERNRKGNFTIKVKKCELPDNNLTVKYRLKRIDFDFGCNIFMLGQYDNDEQQGTYLKQWTNLFNTAVVPLYWEGTEPMQGKLRYSLEVENDIYRRPPVDMVVDFCKKNNIKMKGHPLFWHEFIAQWLPEDWQELYPLIEKRFKEISDRYAESIPVFDCVNEPSRIWDMRHEHKKDNYKMVAPPDGYLEKVFELGERYFSNNELILNEATGASFCEFKGIYGGYYQLIQRLLSQGVKIDRIGLQCHISDSPVFKNLYDAERLYEVLDGYASLGKPLVLSEIGLSCSDEQIQAKAVVQLYKICFSHEKMSGIFWWNLDDNGILCDKKRNAMAENLPFGGLVRNGIPKLAYKELDRLINEEWTTSGETLLSDGKFSFRGFYGEYEIVINGKTYNLNLGKNSDKNIVIEV